MKFGFDIIVKRMGEVELSNVANTILKYNPVEKDDSKSKWCEKISPRNNSDKWKKKGGKRKIMLLLIR